MDGACECLSLGANQKRALYMDLRSPFSNLINWKFHQTKTSRCDGWQATAAAAVLMTSSRGVNEGKEITQEKHVILTLNSHLATISKRARSNREHPVYLLYGDSIFSPPQRQPLFSTMWPWLDAAEISLQNPSPRKAARKLFLHSLVTGCRSWSQHSRGRVRIKW